MAGGTLFIGPTRLGDGVLVTGLVAHLARGGTPLTIACGPTALALFDHAPGIARRLAVSKRPLSLHWLGLWSAVFGVTWDRVVDLRGSALAYAVRARERVVYRPTAANSHRLTELARAMGLSTPPDPRLWLTEVERDAAARLVPAGPFLALGPTANWPGKMWPAERFATLAATLVGPGGALHGASVVVLGAPSEETLAHPLLERLPGAVNLVGSTSVPIAGALLERAALYVGNDSGLMHLAAAAGTPTVGLFGPSRIERYAPWGPRARAVRTPEPYEALFPPGYDRRTTGSLMTSLAVEPVLAACEGLLAKSDGAAA